LTQVHQSRVVAAHLFICYGHYRLRIVKKAELDIQLGGWLPCPPTRQISIVPIFD
jgi:hypothetical protein